MTGVGPLPDNVAMRRLKLTIEYDGGNYHGWQSQRCGGTLQDILEEKIGDIIRRPVRVTGASRTDAGVHALGQVAAFTCDSGLEAPVITRALNAKLPPDIRILRSEEAAADFHPRYDALRKRYFYLVSLGARRSAFVSRYMWNLPSRINFDMMEDSASLLRGCHDFSTFMGAGCSSKTQVRTVYELEVTRIESISFMTSSLSGDFLKFSIEGNAFLRHMVRNIVGTLIEVGKGKLSIGELRRIFEAKDRTLAGPTAPAQGLFLEEITY